MIILTQRQVHEWFRLQVSCGTVHFIPSDNPHINPPINIEVRADSMQAYVEKLESQLVALALALADRVQNV